MYSNRRQAQFLEEVEVQALVVEEQQRFEVEVVEEALQGQLGLKREESENKSVEFVNC